MGDFNLDVSELGRAANEIIAEHNKDAPAFLIKRGLQVIIGSKGHPGVVKLTPEADASKIDAVPRKIIAGVIIKRLKKKGRWPVSPQEVDVLINKEIARRKRSIAYTRGAGWIKAAKDLGGSGVRDGKKGAAQPGFEKSKAAKGFAKRATSGRLEVTIVNAAPAAAKISGPALQKAIDEQVADLHEYGAQQLLKKTFDKHSARA